MIKLLGLLGGLCFGYCGIPASYATLKKGASVGTPVFVAWMLFLGSILMYSYMTLTYGIDYLLTVNYSVQILSWGLIIYYHYFPRNTTIVQETVEKRQ